MDYSAIFSARARGYRDAQQAWLDIRRAELACKPIQRVADQMPLRMPL